MPDVLILHPLLRAGGPHFDILRDNGFDVRVARETPTDAASLVRILDGAQSAIVGTERFTRQAIMAARGLRVIARLGVGYDSIDTSAADEKDIAVTITPGMNHESVAEHALAMIFALSRGLLPRNSTVRTGNWTKRALPRLAGQTLGLVGMGNSAQALARRSAGLGLEILACARRPERYSGAVRNVEFVSFEELLRRSDVLSLHVPFTAETSDLIDERALALMKPTAFIVNTSRGGVINERDLTAALRARRIAGAALDVFEREPLPLDHPLLALENVLVTPHVAGLDERSFHDACAKAAHVLVDLACRRWPADCIVNLRNAREWRW